MRIGTTPTYVLRISQMENLDDVCLAFKQRGKILYKHISDNDGRSGMLNDGAYFTLSERETSMFSEKLGEVERQVKLKYSDGTVASTDVEYEEVVGAVHEGEF